MKKSGKIRGSIYQRLVVSYIIFALVIVLIMAVVIIVTTLFATRGNYLGVYPYDITNSEKCNKNISAIGSIGGWIEELDKEGEVVKVYGIKQTAESAYTADQLFALTSSDANSNQDFIGFINKKDSGEGYFLVIYNRTNVSNQFSIMYTSGNSNNRWFVLAVGLFLVLFVGICLLMGRFLSRRIRRPLKLISEGMRQVKSGDEEIVLDFKSEAEFAEIRDTFNMMMADLRKARREKEEAESKKNKMLLELSHDIRTPTATINSFAAALKEGVVPEEEKLRYYQTIGVKAKRITSLTDSMFMLLRMQNEYEELHKSQTDLGEFLRRQCAEYYQDARDNGLDLEVDMPETAVVYTGDFTLLARAIGNLLTNAVKYNQTGRKIQVSLVLSGGVIKIVTADDGQPIPEEIRARLFDDFFRGDQARKSDGGTGLGLAIVKAIVEKHGGSILYDYVEQENRFVITLQQN